MPPVLWNNYNPGIFIDNQWGMSFIHKTKEALNLISSRSIGKDLLSILSKRHQGVGTTRGKVVVIVLGMGTFNPANGPSSMGKTMAIPMGGTTNRQAPIAGTKIRLPGTGANACVQYNPHIEHQYTRAVSVRTPPFVALAHELIHALHFMSGDIAKPYSWTNGVGNSSCGAILEEARTVGLGRFRNTRISENAIRREQGLTLRTFYSTPGDCDNIRR